jgi:hypothetical protein
VVSVVDGRVGDRLPGRTSSEDTSCGAAEAKAFTFVGQGNCVSSEMKDESRMDTCVLLARAGQFGVKSRPLLATAERKFQMRWPIALSLALVFGGSAIGASTAQTSPPIHAQKLVDEAMAKYPEVVILSMHVTPPGKTDNVVIASSVRPQGHPRSSQLHHKTQPAWIGRKSGADDERVINSGKSTQEINKAANHIEVTLPLQDHSGKTIGAVGAVFAYKEGDDKGRIKRVAEQIRDEWRPQISSRDSLFEPVK